MEVSKRKIKHGSYLKENSYAWTPRQKLPSFLLSVLIKNYEKWTLSGPFYESDSLKIKAG
jgi:hypothetical protein